MPSATQALGDAELVQGEGDAFLLGAAGSVSSLSSRGFRPNVISATPQRADWSRLTSGGRSWASQETTLSPLSSYLVTAIERFLPQPIGQSLKMLRSRVRFALGLQPLSQRWGDRGQPLHRDYLEHFLDEFWRDIRGHCLEFEEDKYASRFGGDRLSRVDVLHKEEGNPYATLVADLTKPNDITSNTFDCIICTYVLDIVFDLKQMVSELHRILKPSGVLLVAVPHIAICYPQHHELWRFTSEGLHLLLTRSFGEGNVMVRAYGNSLTAAGWLRGLVARDFTRNERDYHDPRFALMLCARAVKRNI